MSPVLFAILLLIVGLSLAVLEVLLPSGGLLSIMCFLSLVACIVVAAGHSGQLALLFTFLVVFLTPTVLLLAFKILPRTPWGRRLILRAPDQQESASASRVVSATTSQGLDDLMDAQGTAATPLRPSGIGEFGSRRVSVVTLGEMVEIGQPIRVVEVRGNNVVVEPVEQE
jgi:membrane-bound serine protease (ClpP class)